MEMEIAHHLEKNKLDFSRLHHVDGWGNLIPWAIYFCQSNIAKCFTVLECLLDDCGMLETYLDVYTIIAIP